jgi:Xaa-Pro dipeptidase
MAAKSSVKRIETESGVRLSMTQHSRLPFKLNEYRRRYDHVMNLMKAAGADVLLVRSPENITYLTGYETPGYYGYHCLVVARGEQPVLVGRKLEIVTNAPEFSWLTKIVPVQDHEDPVQRTIDTVKKLKMERKGIGLEKSCWFFTANEYDQVKDALPKGKFVDCSKVIEEARMVKSEPEVGMIKQAVAIADKACLAGIKATKPGVSEDQIAGALHKVWCEEGAEFTGLPNFIVSGRRSGACHATWRGRKMAKNDHCIFEIAASKNRYCGAVFRTATVGNPRAKVRKIFDATKEALEAAIAEIRPGVSAEKVDKAGRDIIKAHGFGQHHHHRLGYSIGINYPPDWGEGQIISIRKGEKRLLQENMTFHLVPGCLIFDDMGLVTSNSVRVTANGCEVLNSIPRKLFEN